MNSKTNVRKLTVNLTQGAVAAALYAAITIAVAPLAYGKVQFRVSEALTILPLFFPAAVPGLAVGCLIANAIGLAMGVTFPLDLIIGTLATLFSAYLSYKLRGVKFGKVPAISMVMPVIFNAFFVGAELSLMFGFPLLMTMLWVGVGEFVVVAVLGVPLYFALSKIPALTLYSNST